MLKEMLIDTFRDGEYFIGCVMWLLFFIAILFILALYTFIKVGNEWSKIPPITHSAKLLSIQYKESTLETNAVPVVNSNGSMGMGFVTTGDVEKHITVWDVGEYGRLVSKDEEVFRRAKSESILLIKVKGSEVRIVGIQ